MSTPESGVSKEAVQVYDFYYSERQASVNQDIRGGEYNTPFDPDAGAPLPVYFIKGVEFTDKVKAGEVPKGARGPYRLVYSGGRQEDIEYR